MIEILTESFQPNIHGVLNLATGVFNFAVGLIVLLHDTKSRVNRSFFILTATTTIWMTCFALQSLTKSQDLALWFQALSYVGGVPFIPWAFLLFVSWWGNRPNRLLILVSFLFALFSALPMVFATKHVVGISVYSWGNFPYFLPTTKGYAYSAFLLIPFATVSIFSGIHCYQTVKRAVTPREKVQSRNVFIAYLFAHTGALDFLAAFRIPWYPFGYISLASFNVAVSYNIVRYQAFRINVLLKKFTLIVLIYAGLVAALLPVGLVLLKDKSGGAVAQIIFISILFGFVLSLGPMLYAFLTHHSFWLKSHSATGLTHELKSPLTTIQSAVDMLMRLESRSTHDHEKTNEYLRIIERNTERLIVFTSDLLQLAKIQNDEWTVEKSPLDLNELITELAASYRLVAESKGLAIHLDLQQIPPIEADRLKIQQVISNLLSNAIKFTDHGSVSVKTETGEGVVLCMVTDTGRGIPKEDHEKIFDRFYQGKHSAKGSGIGLTIAKAWVEAHGGRIWVCEEREGKGTTMKLAFLISRQEI